MGGPTESPFVVARAGRYYLFIGPDWEGLVRSKEQTGRYDWKHYRGTRVLESDDPFHFTLGGQVGFLDSHASEVVVDEGGATWVHRRSGGAAPNGGVTRLAVRYVNDGAETTGSNRFEVDKIVLVDVKSKKKHFPIKDANGQFVGGPIGDTIDGGRIYVTLPPGRPGTLWT